MSDVTAESAATPLDAIGVVCARAAFVASLLGIVEGVVVSRIAELSVSGIGIATAGLWFPAALLFLVPASALRRVPSRVVAVGLFVAFGAALIFARAMPTLAAPLRAGPIEAAAALALAYAASRLELDEPFRRPIAIAGLIVVVALQLYANHWIDAHRAFAGVLVEYTAVPRFMLRTVLHRFA